MSEERLTDVELAEVERLYREATAEPWFDTGYAVVSDAERDCDGTPYVVVEPYCRPADRAFIAAARTLLPRLAASERARRDDAAIGRILDEAGITACEGETLRGRVERLAKRDANLQRWVTVMREARDGVVDDTETAEIRLRHCADAARLEHGGVPLQEHEDRGYLLMVLNEARAARDEQRARAEKAEADLRAPVDVEGMLRSTLTEEDAEGLAREAIELFSTHGCETVQSIMDVLVKADERAREAMRPHAARLAREAEGLREQIAAVIQAAHEAGWNGVENSKILAVFVQNMGADLAAARAEIERLTKALAEAVEQRENLLAEVERLRADLARETARRDDQIAQLERRLGERETEATQYRVAASRAAEVLRAVEWSGVADGGDPGPEPGGCPSCGADEPGPHAAHCALAACLPRGSAERTPDTVLRAMIASYSIGETKARILARVDYRHSRRAAHLHTCRDELVCELADVVNGYPGPDLSQPGLLEDYEARLSGARQLDAPPPEAS